MLCNFVICFKSFLAIRTIGLCIGSSTSVHREMIMWPINFSWLLKLLRQIMQAANLSHDVNSKVLFYFVRFFKGLLAIRTYQLLYLRFWVCSWTDFHVLNKLLLVVEVGMAEEYHELRSLHLLSCFLRQGWLAPWKDQLCWSCCFSTKAKVDVDVLGEAVRSTHSWASTSWSNPRIVCFSPCLLERVTLLARQLNWNWKKNKCWVTFSLLTQQTNLLQ